MADSKPESTAVGVLTSNPEPMAAYQEVDEIAKLLDRFEDIQVESDGYDKHGHRKWEVSVVE